jgi:DNA polymerase
VAMWLAGQDDVLDQLRRGEDPYVDIASQFYGVRVYKPAKDDPQRLLMEQMRGAGKQAKLMCQYGAGAGQFQKTAKAGLYGPPIDMPIADAERFVDLYRRMHPKVVEFWRSANRIISRLAGGPPCEWSIFQVKNGRLYLPSGQMMIYDTLEYHRPEPDEPCKPHEADGYWRMRTRYGWKKMWGSKLLQNCCEAVSRVIVTQAMIRVKRMGIRTLNHPYDELLLLIPKDGREAETAERCRQEMCIGPSWLPGLPLDAEMHLNERYAK